MTTIKCPKCSYEWDTKSRHVFVSCPSCMTKVKIPSNSEAKGIDAKRIEPTGTAKIRGE